MNILDDWVYYDESSPTCLRWKKDKFVGEHLNIHRWIKDSPAGNKGVRRATLTLEGSMYPVHQIVWWLLRKETLNGNVIDHIDGNPHNNRIDNLRLVPQAVNSRNCKKNALNTSGVAGVNLHADKYWRVTWYENRILKCKYFPVGDAGSFEKAVNYRERKIAELNELGYGYTERHGT